MQKPIVLRLSYSAYQGPDYPMLEREKIQGLGVDYTTLDSYKVNNKDELILISNSNVDFTSLDPRILEQTKLLIHPNSGFDNLYHGEQNIKFPCVGGNLLRRDSVSEYVLSCIFENYASFPHQESWDHSRHWPRKLISEQQIQIIGYGHIGKKLENIFHGMDASVSVYDPYKQRNELELSKCDILILVPSLTKTSHHFLNAKNLNELRDGVLIINPSRGKVIEESSLIDYLKSHTQSYCYLDVFEKEPHDFKSFKHINNIKLSSHIAGVYKNLDFNMVQFIEGHISKYLESPKDYLNWENNFINLKDKK